MTMTTIHARTVLDRFWPWLSQSNHTLATMCSRRRAVKHTSGQPAEVTCVECARLTAEEYDTNEQSLNTFLAEVDLSEDSRKDARTALVKVREMKQWWLNRLGELS